MMIMFRMRVTPGKSRLCAGWPCLALFFCLVACTQKTPPVPQAIPLPNATGASRVIIPAAGGQTIRLPRLMADIQTLWSPLTEKEQLVSAMVLPGDGEGAPAGAARWLPRTEYDTMRRYFHRLTHERRDLAARVLDRAQAHLPMFLEQLHRQNLPPELAALPMVESAFEPGAVSPAGAAGIWQLMPETARRFGLRVDGNVDERFDVGKSTTAATAYLAFLYGRFKEWPLALAAYNSGEGAMQRALHQSGCGTLAELTAYSRRVPSGRQVLGEETLRFVPQFSAAVEVMARSRELRLTPEPLPSRLGNAPVMAAPEKTERLSLSGRYVQAEQPVSAPPKSSKLSQTR
jgi:membrane-bound lytic murein transglycosylase D